MYNAELMKKTQKLIKY